MTKNKKTLIIVLSVAAVLLVAVAVVLIVLFTRKPEQPETKEGALYQTEAQIIWSGVAGVSYISFEYVEEPETPEEGALYGNVFNVMADGSTDPSKCTPWLTGTWELEENADGTFGTLTLTATWDESNADATKLTGATSGSPVSYELENGEYNIGVSFSSGAELTFTLDPVADAVGEGETPTPDEPDEPDEPDKPDEPDDPDVPVDKNVQLTLMSEANAAGQIGRILMYDDGSWEFSVCFYGDVYSPMASGTWSLRADYSGIDLTVTEDAANVLGGNGLVVALDASDPADIAYSVTVSCNIPQVGELTFEMGNVDNEEPSPEPEPEPEPENVIKTEEESFWAGVGKAYMAFDETAGTFSLMVNAGDGNYSSWLSGTYTLADGVLTLTAAWADGAAATLADAVSGEPETYDVTNGTYTIGVEMMMEGTVNFKFIPDPSAVQEITHYTVVFDFGNGTTYKAVTSSFEMADGTVKQYLPASAAPSVPSVTGKRFAGWDTSAAPVLKDGVSETEFILGPKINEFGAMMGEIPVENDVMEVTENMTLYARWVSPTRVYDEEDLVNMKNDLNGWYVLQNDITLTGEWMPVGVYYGSYEYLDTGWWKYAFGGELDGNGYTIRGLNITTLTPYGDTVHPEEGSGNGTTALFGSICNATVTDLVIEAPVIDITGYTGEFHGYVSVVAAFVQGGDTKIENVYVTDASISLDADDIAYIAVAGILGGHWGGTMSNCSASGTITVNADYSAGFDQAAVNLYAGGLVGEGYCWVNNCTSEMQVTLNVTDARAAAANTINVYMGAIGASTAYTANDCASGSLSLDYSGVENTPVVAYVGGIGGIQRYGYLDYTVVDTAIGIVTNGSEGSTLYAGSLLGGYDAITSLLYLHGTNDLKARQCTDSGVICTLDGTAGAAEFIGYAPKTQEEMATGAMIAGFMGIDLSVYIDEDGNYDIYGTDRCTRTAD